MTWYKEMTEQQKRDFKKVIAINIVGAINLTAPLMGIVLLIQSVQEWKQQRSVAIFGLCAALFIFGCAIVVWFV